MQIDSPLSERDWGSRWDPPRKAPLKAPRRAKPPGPPPQPTGKRPVRAHWIVAIIIMALGLGYTVANSRRDRIDVINQQAEGQPGAVPGPAERPH